MVCFFSSIQDIIRLFVSLRKMPPRCCGFLLFRDVLFKDNLEALRYFRW